MTIITWQHDAGGLGVKTELNLVQSCNRGFTVRVVSAAFQLQSNDKQQFIIHVKTDKIVFFQSKPALCYQTAALLSVSPDGYFSLSALFNVKMIHFQQDTGSSTKLVSSSG